MYSTYYDKKKVNDVDIVKNKIDLLFIHFQFLFEFSFMYIHINKKNNSFVIDNHLCLVGSVFMCNEYNRFIIHWLVTVVKRKLNNYVQHWN